MLFGGKKNSLAHNIVVRVEKLVDRLKTEIRHPNPVRVGKGERHAQAIDVRLTDVADFLRERGLCGFFLLPGIH